MTNEVFNFNELMYWLEAAVDTIQDRIEDNDPIFADKEQETAYKFGLICAYDILKNRLEDVTDIQFEDMIRTHHSDLSDRIKDDLIKPSKYKFSRIKGNTIWEVRSNSFGPFYFTFDRKKIYNFWEDYEKLSDIERDF